MYYKAILLFFILFPAISFCQKLSTEDKIEILGLGGQSTEVINASADADYSIEELEQSNKIKGVGIPDFWIIYILKERIKLSISEIDELKSRISKGYSEQLLKKSLDEKVHFGAENKTANSIQDPIKSQKLPTSTSIKNYDRFRERGKTQLLGGGLMLGVGIGLDIGAATAFYKGRSGTGSVLIVLGGITTGVGLGILISGAVNMAIYQNHKSKLSIGINPMNGTTNLCYKF